MELSKKTIGIMLLGFSLALIFLLYAVKTNYDSQAGILCEKLHQEPNYDPASCPVVQDKTSWFFVAGFAIGLVFLLLGAFLFLTKASESAAVPIYSISSSSSGIPEKASFVQVNESELDEDEKKVYSFLKQRG